jgi:hypothetical protein
MQPGSQTDGPLAALDDLQFAEFSVNILDQTVIDTCSENKIIMTDLTFMTPQVSRANSLEYRIVQAGETQEETVVPGLAVAPTVPI